MAPHGTTLGYEARDGLVYPVFEHNPADQDVQGLAERIQQGALHFIDMAMPYVERVGYESLVSTAWAEPFYRLITDPTIEEAEHLGDISHSDMPTKTTHRLSLAPSYEMGLLTQWTPSYRRALEDAYWKKGFLVRNRLNRGSRLRDRNVGVSDGLKPA
jgi:hypothetical protein